MLQMLIVPKTAKFCVFQHFYKFEGLYDHTYSNYYHKPIETTKKYSKDFEKHHIYFLHYKKKGFGET